MRRGADEPVGLVLCPVFSEIMKILGVPFAVRSLGSPSEGKPSLASCSRILIDDSSWPRVTSPSGGRGIEATCVSLSPSCPAMGRLNAFSAHSVMFSQIRSVGR